MILVSVTKIINLNWLHKRISERITSNVCAAVRTANRQLGYEACTVDRNVSKKDDMMKNGVAQ